MSRKNTGWYLPGAAYPYYVLSPYFDIDFAVPKGPNPPVDPSSTELSGVKADDYDAIFHVGGYGPIIDLPEDPANIKLGSDDVPFLVEDKIKSLGAARGLVFGNVIAGQNPASARGVAEAILKESPQGVKTPFKGVLCCYAQSSVGNVNVSASSMLVPGQ
ncbi:hypothetical protein M404DRAFT_19602 [Pisolithus tinctorius Marx 270]|uniref:DJ-1/PfpI domain-containing protein n=1 Tax=Pisolithus tinctorius Marx 270 TaxID=870435 RepID=A0A0C3PVM3_PISTI|nr:hypothetical protein M404DRAFT_19602 [Pisolithus tinctorius Marx 270]